MTIEQFLERKLEQKTQEVKVLKEDINELQQEIKELELQITMTDN